MIKKMFSFVGCFLLLTACTNGYKTIDSNRAMELIEDGAVVVDVRTSDEYKSGYIENSINIPVDNISDIEYDKETVIIVYCASGMRSAEAAKILIQEGYTNVYNLDGGLINWGFELVE